MKKNKDNKAIHTAECLSRCSMAWMTLMSVLFFSISSFAYTSCIGGTIIKRNEYGEEGAPAGCTETTCPVHKENESPKTFCRSNSTMNWWTAFNWCQANGGTLASFESMCPRTTAKHGGYCPALDGVSTASNPYGRAWSSLGSGNRAAFSVYLTDGKIDTSGMFNYVRYASHWALCE